MKNDQKLIKIIIKNEWKTVILNGKIEFFVIFDLIDTKNSEKWPKIDTHLEYKNMIKFDYQKGG